MSITFSVAIKFFDIETYRIILTLRKQLSNVMRSIIWLFGVQRSYERFVDLRNRPFLDLLGRVGTERSPRMVDLDCDNGSLILVAAHHCSSVQVGDVFSST